MFAQHKNEFSKLFYAMTEVPTQQMEGTNGFAQVWHTSFKIEVSCSAIVWLSSELYQRFTRFTSAFLDLLALYSLH